MDSPPSHSRDAERLIYAGLLGLTAASITQLNVSELSAAQTVEVYAFALAIPLLAVGLVTDYARREGTVVPPWRDALGFLGCFAAVVGLAALFFHFGVGPGLLFSVGSLCGFALIRML